MNFAYDIIDKRASLTPNKIAVRWHSPDNIPLEISNADLKHHSDVTAYYLQRMGIVTNSVVALYGIEETFEMTTIITALHKLYATPMFDLTGRPIEACNQQKAYAIISKHDSFAIDIINSRLHELTSIEIKISVGKQYPNNWFDLHTGTRLAGIFKRTKNPPQNYNAMIINSDTPQLYDKTYPFNTHSEYLWDKFYQSLIDGKTFEF